MSKKYIPETEFRISGIGETDHSGPIMIYNRKCRYDDDGFRRYHNGELIIENDISINVSVVRSSKITQKELDDFAEYLLDRANEYFGMNKEPVCVLDRKSYNIPCITIPSTQPRLQQFVKDIIGNQQEDSEEYKVRLVSGAISCEKLTFFVVKFMIPLKAQEFVDYINTNFKGER